MSVDSGGKTSDVNKKHLDNRTITKIKTRSNSTGHINLSVSEINKIIGIGDINKKPQDILGTKKEDSSVANKHHTEINKLDCMNAIGVGENKLDDKKNNPDDVFLPRMSISRTPTKIDNIGKMTDTMSQKRGRSETSPTGIEDRQKIRKQTNGSPEIQLADSEGTAVAKNLLQDFNVTEENGTGNNLQNILDALETIYSFTESVEHNKDDLSKMRKATFKVHKMVTSLAYKVGQLEKENYILQQKVNSDKNFNNNQILRSFPLLPKATTSSDNSYLKVNQIENFEKREKTYSTITKLNGNAKQTGTEDKWETPPQKKKHETIIRLKKEGNAKKVLKEIKHNLIQTGEFNENFKNIRDLPSGGVIVECHSESQQKKWHKILEKHSELQIREIENTDPMLMITGIEKGYSSQDFIKELIMANPQIQENFGEDVESKIKFIVKKECRNKTKENWILQTNPEIFKWLIKSDNLSFDLTRAYVQEYTNLAMCYKCCSFGHVAKYCKGEVCCHKCGGKHEGRQCLENSPLDCPNCKRLQLNDRVHTARDPKCPAYLKKLERHRQNINYGSNKESGSFL